MNKLKDNKAITLIALIITVIIMLILAGVSISILTGDNGLFYKTTAATTEYKKQSMLEAIDNAELQIKMGTFFDRTGTVTVEKLKNKLAEISDIKDGNEYKVSTNDEEQIATIIDIKTGIVIDITINAKGEVLKESSIVNNIAEAIKPTIEYTLDPDAGTYAEEITITITAKEESNGIVKIQFPDNTEKTYSNQKTVIETYKVTQNDTYKFTAESANGRKTTKYVEIKNSMQASNISMTVQNGEPTNDKTTLAITYDPNIKVGGQALTNSNRFQYSVGENNWQTASANQTVSVFANEIVYARYFDGTNGYKTTSIAINNIDKVAPTAFNLTVTKTTNSITVSGSTTDTGSTGCAAGNVGIVGYQFKLMNNAGTTITDWTAIQTGTSYTFNQNISQTTDYKVSMRAVDKAGNITEATNKNSSVTTGTVIDSSTKIGIAYSPSTSTNGNVTITLTNNSGVSGLTMKYQIGSTTGTWTNYTVPLITSTNGVVYARLFDSTNQFTNTATANVVNIDKLVPTTSTVVSSNVEATTFTLTATGADAEATSTNAKSGVSKYEFYINNTLENTVNTTNGTATYNVTGKAGSTNYTCKVRVYDAAGNYKESSEITVTTKTAGNPMATAVKVGDYVAYDAGTWNSSTDTSKITSSGGTVTWSSSLPTTQGQFGGFTNGQSRNTNSTTYSSSSTPRTAGWRVWDIDSTTGVVTLISAGNPETYYHASGYSAASVKILTNRNCSMYVNSHATSAKILTGQEAARWYNKQYGTNYTIVENGGTGSTFWGTDFSTAAPIDVLENGSYYWLASAYDSSNLYGVFPGDCHVDFLSSGWCGVRLLVSLKSDILLEPGTGNGSVGSPWKIVETSSDDEEPDNN